jgi:FkbM family methyltransferase
MILYMIKIYRFIFARPLFLKWNNLLYRLSLSGLGILNYENPKVSGESYFVNKLVSQSNDDGVIIDAGANQGSYSLMCFKACTDTQIYSFEPHPKTFISLMKNLSGQNSVCVNKALGASCGVLELFDYADRDGSSHASLYSGVIEEIHHANVTSHRVEVTTVDNFIKENKINKVKLLKIDTEGHELEVLKGASIAINSRMIIVIHFEFNEMNVISRSFFKDFVELLPEYDFYRLLPSGMISLKYSPLKSEIFAYQNIVAILRGQSWVI